MSYNEELTSIFSHLYEVFILFTVTFLYLIKFKFRILYPENYLFKMFLGFYFLSLLSTIWSVDPLTTLYHSSKGLLYTVIASYIAEEVTRKKSRLLNFLTISLWILILSALINALALIPVEVILKKGFQGGYLTLLCICIFIALQKEKRKRETFSFKEVPFYYLGSLSSIISLWFTRIGTSLIFGAWSRRLLSIISLIMFSILVYAVLISGIGLIGKDSNAVATGSGRFVVWLFVINQWISDPVALIGNGMFTDRSYLSTYQDDLPWAHTLHSSPLSLYQGLGVVGAIIYLQVIVHTLKSLILRKKAYLTMLLSFTIYGITSNVFPGMPSLLIIFLVVFYKTEHNKSANNAI